MPIPTSPFHIQNFRCQGKDFALVMLDNRLLVDSKTTCGNSFETAVLDLLKIVTALLGCRLCSQYVTSMTFHMKTTSTRRQLYSTLVAVQSSSCLRSPAYNSHVCFVALDCIAQAHVEIILNHVIHAAFKARTHQP